MRYAIGDYVQLTSGDRKTRGTVVGQASWQHPDPPTWLHEPRTLNRTTLEEGYVIHLDKGVDLPLGYLSHIVAGESAMELAVLSDYEGNEIRRATQADVNGDRSLRLPVRWITEWESEKRKVAEI